MTYSRGATGACGELYVCQYFLTKGYQVFRNVAPTGSVDIIIYKDGVSKLIDVKTTTTAYTRKDGSIFINVPCEKRGDIWLLAFNAETNELHFPEGFWE